MPADPILSFDPIRILDELRSNGVEFVLIGGLAGRLYGSPTVTNDLDICYRRTKENCARLAAALSKLGARYRDLSEELPQVIDFQTIWQGSAFTFVTDAGFLDCLAEPEARAATNYDDLLRSAETIPIGDSTIHVCALEDLIRMKRAAGRPKDLIAVEWLSAVRDELAGSEPPEA